MGLTEFITTELAKLNVPANCAAHTILFENALAMGETGLDFERLKKFIKGQVDSLPSNLFEEAP